MLCLINDHDGRQVIATTEDPSKLYNTSMCGTTNNRVINGQPVNIIHTISFTHTSKKQKFTLSPKKLAEKVHISRQQNFTNNIVKHHRC